jgi:hypothetical protein
MVAGNAMVSWMQAGMMLAALLALAAHAASGADAGSEGWTFEIRQDSFGDDALLDLRGFNEDVAGQSGWMYAKDGKLWIPGSDRPFRGWSAGLRPFGFSYEMDELKYTARTYAKLGINQVRDLTDGPTSVMPTSDADDVTEINYENLAKIHLLVAAMKQEGIYVTYCPWWHYPTFQDHPQVPGYVRGARPYYWCDDLRAIQKEWYRKLLATVNPHTGLPLAKDPAMNILELQNEQNLMFGFGNPGDCDPARWTILRRRFTDWARGKHGSLAKALGYWDLSDEELGEYVEGEGEDALLVIQGAGVMGSWALERQSPAVRRFIADHLEFIIHLERDYNEDMARFIKDELGYGGLILGGDWWAFDRTVLQDAAHYGTLPPGGDCIAYHQYSSFFHTNPENPGRARWAVRPGDYYLDGSVLANPGYMPTSYRRMRGVPMICTEMGLPEPNRFGLEGQLAAAAYGAMHDFDQITWLQVEFMGIGRHIPWGEYYNKFNHNWPQLMGQFPGAALLFRMGYVTDAQPVIYEGRTVADLANRKPPLVANVMSGDPNYRRPGSMDDPDAATGRVMPSGIDPLAFLVGPVEWEVTDRSAAEVDDAALASCIDRENKQVRSATGEIQLDWGRQLLTIDTPCARGIVGLVGRAGAVELSGVTIDSSNDLGAILAISMDGRPIAESGKILIQAASEAHLSGRKAEVVPDGTTIQVAGRGGEQEELTLPAGTLHLLDIGDQPFVMDAVRATVTLKAAAVTRATALDMYGYPDAEQPVAVRQSGAGLVVELPRETYYTVLQ